LARKGIKPAKVGKEKDKKPVKAGKERRKAW